MMWKRLHRASLSRVAVAPSLFARPALRCRPLSSNSTDSIPHKNAAAVAGDAVGAPQSPADDRVLTDQDRARVSLSLFSTAIRNAKSSAALTEMWSVLARHEPVFVQGESLQVASELGEQTTVPEDQVLLRMVSASEMLRLHEQGQRTVVVERALVVSGGGEQPKDLPVSADRVLMLSENFVVRKFVMALYLLKDFEALAQYVESIIGDRRLDASKAETGSESEDAKRVLAELHELDDHNDKLYVSALGHLKEHSKIIDHVKPHENDLRRYIMQRDAFSSLLTACVKTREGSLARTAIDQSMDSFPLLTFNVRTYTAGLHANLRAKPKTLEGLKNAMHIYRRMFHEAGYILAPQEWSMLFNSGIYLGQKEMAIEIFKDYRTHGIAPFQQRFEQALRTACRFQQYDTAIEMARLWIETEENSPPVLTVFSRERLRMDEAECFNKIMWEMLKETPALDQVEQVVLLMQSREIPAGALVIRRIVDLYLRDVEGSEHQQSPDDMISRLFNLWESCPDVVQRTGFVLHLVLEACSARGWNDQCARVIQYANRHQINPPIGRVTKIMEELATRGKFDEAIQLGELVLEPRFQSSRRTSRDQLRIPDDFFECLLTSYVFRQRFEDVMRVGEAFQLGDRRGETNVKVAAILRDAQSMI